MKTIKNKYGDVYAGHDKFGAIFLGEQPCRKCVYHIDIYTCKISTPRTCNRFGDTGYYDTSIEVKIQLFLNEDNKK